MRANRLALLAVIALSLGLGTAAFAQAPRQAGPASDEAGPLREQVWWVPVRTSADPTQLALLETTVYRPPGSGPFPLIIISHGSPRNNADRRNPRQRFLEQSRWFVGQGYAVAVPMRRGYANSEGASADGMGGCENPNYLGGGAGVTSDLFGTMRFFKAQSFVDGKRIILVGQSVGGFGSLATAAWNPEGVLAVINFAGGHGSLKPNEVCAPDRLVAAFADYGRKARVPSLWLYAENDLFFAHIVKRLFEAYTSGGAPAEFVQMRSYGMDGHGVFPTWDASHLWVIQVGKFLQGLPVRTN